MRFKSNLSLRGLACMGPPHRCPPGCAGRMHRLAHVLPAHNHLTAGALSPAHRRSSSSGFVFTPAQGSEPPIAGLRPLPLGSPGPRIQGTGPVSPVGLINDSHHTCENYRCQGQERRMQNIWAPFIQVPNTEEVHTAWLGQCPARRGPHVLKLL